MIREMIELAEEIYARGNNPNLSPEANGEEFRDFAVRLGYLIEDVGMAIRKYQEKLEQQSFHIRHLQNKIKELTEE